MLAFLVALAAAQPELGEGQQTITLLVRGVGSGTKIEAERAGVGTIELADPGIGLLRGRFHGEPARFAQLRLTAVSGGERRPIYDSLIIVGDAEEELLAFDYRPDGPARRIPIAPSARVDVAMDESVTWWVGFGWGAVALGWVGVTGVLWALRRR